MGMNSLPKTVTRQHHGCSLNPGSSALEPSTLTTRLTSHLRYVELRQIVTCGIFSFTSHILHFMLLPSQQVGPRIMLSGCPSVCVHMRVPRWKHFWPACRWLLVLCFFIMSAADVYCVMNWLEGMKCGVFILYCVNLLTFTCVCYRQWDGQFDIGVMSWVWSVTQHLLSCSTNTQVPVAWRGTFTFPRLFALFVLDNENVKGCFQHTRIMTVLMKILSGTRGLAVDLGTYCNIGLKRACCPLASNY